MVAPHLMQGGRKGGGGVWENYNPPSTATSCLKYNLPPAILSTEASLHDCHESFIVGRHMCKLPLIPQGIPLLLTVPIITMGASHCCVTTPDHHGGFPLLLVTTHNRHEGFSLLLVTPMIARGASFQYV